MAIAFDASATSTYTGNTSWSFSHTCTGSDRYLIVAVAGTNGGITGVTYNGVAMTSLGSIVQASLGYQVRLWGLIAPATGANNIAFAFTGPPGVYAAISSSYTGVHQTTAVGTPASLDQNNSSNASISINVPSAVGDLVVDGMFVYNRTITVGAGQTQIGNIINNDDTARLGSSREPGSATQTAMSWSWSGGQFSSAIGIALKPSASSASVVPVIMSQFRQRL